MRADLYSGRNGIQSVSRPFGPLSIFVTSRLSENVPPLVPLFKNSFMALIGPKGCSKCAGRVESFVTSETMIIF